ncbi:hypothetical protein G7011_00325 [Pseudomonas plecoglossicida]|uniref:hypothetical protein n=1 Tax=Pseudomonas plecoglossicida TaxID=70775 RepID=UPI0015E2BCC7|nr:hypothetical protein [Pseudomonas plecoglossicida]MBA1195558.1 hypothetical protein [Pseudomonas plecoglossicida]
MQVQGFIDGAIHTVVESWPIVAAVLLILLKQLYKLYANHRPDKVDWIKAVASLPLDVSFMVVGIFVKIAIAPEENNSLLGGLFFLYSFIGFFAAILWRVCENAIKSDAMPRVLWAFSLNSAISGAGLFVAIKCVG